MKENDIDFPEDKPIHSKNELSISNRKQSLASRRSKNIKSSYTDFTIMKDKSLVNNTSEKQTTVTVATDKKSKELLIEEEKEVDINPIRVESKSRKSGRKTAKGSSVEARKAKRKRVLRTVIIIVTVLIIAVVGAGFWTFKHFLGKINTLTSVNNTFVNDDGETIKITTEETSNTYINGQRIHNFLLIGIDSRSKDYAGDGTGSMSDINMVLSVDEENKTLKLISIARDSYANIPGNKKTTKINAAMSKGGPNLLKSTIESSLRIPIDGFAYVNFYNMVDIIDEIGGVYVNLSKDEVNVKGGINDCLLEVNKIHGYDLKHDRLTEYGEHYKLNGIQAVAYARIRKVGNGDYERSERQVEVLRSLMEQFMQLSIPDKAKVMGDILGLITTDISQDEIQYYVLKFLPALKNANLEYMPLPIQPNDGKGFKGNKKFFVGGMFGDEWSIRPNWNAMIPFVQQFFYGETTNFDAVDVIPNAPTDKECPQLQDVDFSTIVR